MPSALERPGRPRFLARRTPQRPGMLRASVHGRRNTKTAHAGHEGKKGRPSGRLFCSGWAIPPYPPEGGQIPRRSLRSTGAEQKSSIEISPSISFRASARIFSVGIQPSISAEAKASLTRYSLYALSCGNNFSMFSRINTLFRVFSAFSSRAFSAWTAQNAP